MRIFLWASLLAVVSAASAAEWNNVDSAHYLGGRKASPGYLQGKVVFVVRWSDDSAETKELLKRVEELWMGFKTKQFVILGASHFGEASDGRAKALVREAGVSFPVYAFADLTTGAPAIGAAPLYVADETGKIVYLGRKDRLATQAIVGAITDLESPRSVKQWRRFLDYELAHLPAHAYLRLKAFNKQHPDEAKDYFSQAKELMTIPDLKKVVSLVEFSRRAKDAPSFTDKEKRIKYESLVSEVLTSCASLKDVEDTRLQQEAKNALADLVWTKASF